MATGEVYMSWRKVVSSKIFPLKVTAGKIVPKSLLTKSHQKEKMSQEIRSVLSKPLDKFDLQIV